MVSCIGAWDGLPRYRSGIRIANPAFARSMCHWLAGMTAGIRIFMHQRGVQPHEQAIERDEAGAPMEDAIEAGTQFAAAPRRGFGAIRLEVIVKPPDQRTHALPCGAMQIGDAVQLVHQPFCMRSLAERVLANCELARVVTHNDHLAQQPVRAWMLPHGMPLRWRYRSDSSVTCTVVMSRRSRCVRQELTDRRTASVGAWPTDE